MTSSNLDLGKGLPSSPTTFSPFACKYAIISVSGLRLIAENGKFLQSFESVEGKDEVGGDVLGVDMFGTGATVLVLLVLGMVVVAKNAFSTKVGSDTTLDTGGGLNGGCGCIGVAV
jgi:hypothetical protein